MNVPLFNGSKSSAALTCAFPVLRDPSIPEYVREHVGRKRGSNGGIE